MGLVAAGIGGGVISAGASLIGSGMQANATTSAASAANATQMAMFNKDQANEAPYVAAGTGALSQQQNLLGLNGQTAAASAMKQFTASPGYQYQLQQGLSAVDNGAAANGMLRSGNTLRAEQTLGDNLASQDFGNYYNRLAGISGLGQNAAANVGNAGIQTGQGIASTDTSSGNQLANIYGNQANGLGSVINNGINNYASLGGFGNSQNTSLGSASIPQSSSVQYNALNPTFPGLDG